MSVTINKDFIFEEKLKSMKSTIVFLEAIKKHVKIDKAVSIANEAAANYLISVYEEVFKGTVSGTQDRFNAFRRYYEKYPDICSYCEVLTSNDTFLKVKYNRCPNAEILSSLNLFDFAEASCVSDKVMTDKLLPGVAFTRESSIVSGQDDCIMIWEYKGDL